jgi:hypothetical protein
VITSSFKRLVKPKNIGRVIFIGRRHHQAIGITYCFRKFGKFFQGVRVVARLVYDEKGRRQLGRGGKRNAMADFATQDIEKFNEYSGGNKDIFRFVPKSRSGLDSYVVVPIARMKERNKPARISNNNALATFRHRDIRQSERTNRRAL